MTSKITEEDILRKKRVYCLGLLRNARALILRDAESFHEAATALEKIGQVWGSEIQNGMARYEPILLKLSEAIENDKVKIGRLFDVVRNARNMAVHEGAWARHLSSRLIDLFLILEEAIMKKMQFVEDIMVRNPVIAEPWHMVAQVRREMLANSFSCLPISHDGKWLIISDVDVMRFLRQSSNRKEETERLSANLGSAIDNSDINPAHAEDCPPNATIDDLLKKLKNLPMLVFEEIAGEKRLVGIVTPFDLL